MNFRKLISISLITASSLLCIGLAGSNNVSANANHHKQVHKVANKKKNVHKKSKAKKHVFKPVVNKWYKGTPKKIRGTWYHNDEDSDANAYITYTNNKSSGNFFDEDFSKRNTYKPELGEGLLDIHYRYLEGYTYQISGIRYSTASKNGAKFILTNHDHYSYKVKIYPKNLHFYLGHGVKDYVRKANFKIENNN